MGQHAADNTPEDARRRPVVEGTTAVVGGHALAEEVLVLDCKQGVERRERREGYEMCAEEQDPSLSS